jgi:hypothetical protein
MELIDIVKMCFIVLYQCRLTWLPTTLAAERALWVPGYVSPLLLTWRRRISLITRIMDARRDKGGSLRAIVLLLVFVSLHVAKIVASGHVAGRERGNNLGTSTQDNVLQVLSRSMLRPPVVLVRPS